MSIAFTSIKGTTFYNSRKAYAGFNLLTPIEGEGVWLIDMMGELVHYWGMGCRPGCYGELLPNGHLLYQGKIDSSPLAHLEGAGGILLEADWQGNVLWEYRDPYLHHAFYRMENGNTLVLKWIVVPDGIACNLKGGFSNCDDSKEIWGDCIQEIDPDGKVVWEWIGHDHLDPEVDEICPLCPRTTWTHANACVECPNGDILVSFMKTNTLAIIDKKNGHVKRRLGSGEFTHQHSPNILDNGNVLVFDNGFHELYAPNVMSRVLELNPNDGTIVWCFGESNERHLFYSSTMSSCQRLPNGNTFICEGTWGRIFEVDQEGELVWEFVNNFPSFDTSPTESKSSPVYSAYRYGLDYSGLSRSIRKVGQRQISPAAAKRDDETAQSRSEIAGY